MWKVIAIMALGMLVGFFMRKSTRAKNWTEKLTSGVIFLLLFVMGVAIGTDETIMSSLHTLGIQALIITLGAVAGSVLLAWWVYVTFFHKKQKEL
jgi:uncharacterized membrane protein YbjE (DUF340 family)